MDNVVKLVLDVYNKMIGIILDGLDEAYYDEVKKTYYKELLNKYNGLEISDEKYNLFFQTFLDLEEKKWKSLSKNEKLHLLVEDDNLEKIISISNSGFMHALDRRNKDVTISKDVVDEGNLKMKELLTKVLEFNKEVASWYVSEGSIDYLYASGQTDKTSFRLKK